MTPTDPAAPPVPAEQRQLNLLHALRHTRAGLTAAELVGRVEGYGTGSPASERRKFERDKDVLRELGISIRTTPDAGEAEGVEVRYRVDDADYELPPVRLTPAQAAALALAASAWRDGELPATAQRALTKLRATAEPAGASAAVPGPGAGGEGLRVRLDGAALDPVLLAAVDERRVVSFDYASASSGRVSCRTVEPHHVTRSGPAWYLDAVEARTGERRTFRLERVVSPVTALGAPGAFERLPRQDPGVEVAVLALAPGAGLVLRARALPGGAGGAAGDAAAGAVACPPGRDVVRVRCGSPQALAGQLAGMGEDVVVLGPPSLREAVQAHLHGAASLAVEVC